MKLLLDTHAFIWAVMDTAKLSPTAKFHLLKPGSDVYVSAVSLWEIAIKHALGKLDLKGVDPLELAGYATGKMGFKLLDLDAELAAGYESVPAKHPDPFDRMLIHQAVALGLHVVSADKRFPLYVEHGLKLIW
ncbi:type II toxin-antitoxin system VapC family toxin [Pontiella sulfatireligans]|uniref:PIN domain-containing protein n=1 Tax=Pontiella sulfatireligans TaxID=2750658 RepID=A0A6C2UEA3_9BACT|nr:type II toxin-antitoxin system VapC family toxin [Pontiella sulfatireligans]VGO18500.1 hypothetical protein SCARR_00553 [Pontiella sulfatireligans]